VRPVKHAIDTTLLRVVPTGGNRNVIAEGSDWTPEPFAAGSLNGFFVNEQVIDLTGMAVQHKTFYPESFNIQSGPVRYVSPGNQGAGALIEMHWIQTKPFDFFDYRQGVVTLEQLVLLPGLLQTTTSFDQVICGEWTTYTSSVSQIPAIECYPSSSGRFGSMSPVAADRLYYYRFVIASNVEAAATAYGVPATRFEIFGQEGEPADLDYIMQLKRNAELQQSYDED